MIGGTRKSQRYIGGHRLRFKSKTLPPRTGHRWPVHTGLARRGDDHLGTTRSGGRRWQPLFIFFSRNIFFPFFYDALTYARSGGRAQTDVHVKNIKTKRLENIKKKNDNNNNNNNSNTSNRSFGKWNTTGDARASRLPFNYSAAVAAGGLFGTGSRARSDRFRCVRRVRDRNDRTGVRVARGHKGGYFILYFFLTIARVRETDEKRAIHVFHVRRCSRTTTLAGHEYELKSLSQENLNFLTPQFPSDFVLIWLIILLDNLINN